MVIGNIVIVPLLGAFIYFMSKVAKREKYLSSKGKFKTGINIPDLKIADGYKINREQLSQFMVIQTLYFSCAIWLSMNIMWYVIDNQVLSDLMATWLFISFSLVVAIIYAYKMMTINNNIDKYIEKGE